MTGKIGAGSTGYSRLTLRTMVLYFTQAYWGAVRFLGLRSIVAAACCLVFRC